MMPLTMTGSSSSESPSKLQSSSVLRKGAWTQVEDALLRECIDKHGLVRWNRVPQLAGLNRCRKSCRLRWLNYLSPRIKRGTFDEDEEDLIIRLHKLLGNRWSLIAGRLPGRTANDVKNYWNSHLSKKLISGYKKDGAHRRVATPIRPQPRTIPVKRNCSKKQKTVTDEQHADTQPQPSNFEDHTTWVDHLILDDEMYNKENMQSQRTSDLGFDDIEGFREDQGSFLERISGWENLFSDINLWDETV